MPVFAISVDLGKIQSTTSPVTWAVGYVRDPSIAYTAPDGTMQDLSPYYTTRYPGPNITQAVSTAQLLVTVCAAYRSTQIDDFAAAFPYVQQRAIALDDGLMRSAAMISPQYADLVALAARQVMGSLDITVSAGADGKPNASDVRIFMKDIGSSASTGYVFVINRMDAELTDRARRVNPVEQMYAALPLFLCMNASLVGPLLAPLLDAQDALVEQPYAAQDIGMLRY